MNISKNPTISSPPVIVITGLGGIGKTQLVRRFVQKNRSIYTNVIWINCEKQESMSRSLRRLAEDRLGVLITHPDGRMKDMNSIAEHIFDKVHKTKTLCVYDNVDNADSINFLLTIESMGEKPHVIITSRVQEWGSEIPVIQVKELEFLDAILYVTKTLTDSMEDSDDNKKLLVETLQAFPLALRQATAYINYQRKVYKFRISDYIEKFDTQEVLNSILFKKIPCSLYEQTTLTTWKVTIDSIEADNANGQLAVRILKIMAYFDAENILRDIFKSLMYSEESRELSKRAKIDYDEKLKSAVRLLVHYSMVDSQDRQSVLNIHRLVQQVMKLNLHETNQEKIILQEALSLVSELIDVKHTELDVIVSHAISVFLSALNMFRKDPDESFLEEFSDLPGKIIVNLTKNVKSNQAKAFSENVSKMFLPALMNVLGMNSVVN